MRAPIGGNLDAYQDVSRKRRGRKRSTAPQKAVAYLRTSTEEQSLGPEAQRFEIEAWAKLQGVTIVGWHTEHVSGAAPLDERPILWDAVADAIAKRAGALVVAKRDRLARDPINTALITKYVERENIRVRSADGAGDDRTPEGKLLQAMIDAIAAYERALIGIRTKAALRAKRARGERGPGKLPYGTQLAADGKTLEPNPAEAEVIAKIRTLRSAGLSLTQIAETLNSERVPARGARWHRTTIHKILLRA